MVSLANFMPLSFAKDMASFNPLVRILEDNKLTGPNYIGWKRNLTQVLTATKVHLVLTTEAPELPGPDAPQDHVGMASSMDIMYNPKEMFGQQNRNARQIAIKGLVSTKMVEGTPARDHLLKMMGYLNELEVLGEMLDAESQVDMVLASLPPSFNNFVMNYHMNKPSMTLT
ncbi:uncharacterized protein LOC143888954 [Tasmannia lanceolata]|uniref:uncharacterized protein LOC143859701 n=1 Tax=Tasmannia lanceolata TaxID=3420 RepID=UPI0040639D63